jgi:hypothetical protein
VQDDRPADSVTYEVDDMRIRDGLSSAERPSLRHRQRLLLASIGVFLAAACASNPDGGCPRMGLDSGRRCKRLCVVSPRNSVALSCACAAECLCWQMPGHSAQKEGSEPPNLKP